MRYFLSVLVALVLVSLGHCQCPGGVCPSPGRQMAPAWEPSPWAAQPSPWAAQPWAAQPGQVVFFCPCMVGVREIREPVFQEAPWQVQGVPIQPWAAQPYRESYVSPLASSPRVRYVTRYRSR